MIVKEEVTHSGIVKLIKDKTLIISIIVKSGCASCEIKTACSLSEQTEKEIIIENNTSVFTVGQRVNVKMRSSNGFKALGYGYIYPFILLIVAMFATSLFTSSDAVIGIVALLILIPYYILLYFLRTYFKNKFTYSIEPL